MSNDRESGSITQAKAVFGHIAINVMGYSGRRAGKFLNIGGYSPFAAPMRVRRLLTDIPTPGILHEEAGIGATSPIESLLWPGTIVLSQ